MCRGVLGGGEGSRGGIACRCRLLGMRVLCWLEGRVGMMRLGGTFCSWEGGLEVGRVGIAREKVRSGLEKFGRRFELGYVSWTSIWNFW